MQIAETNPEPRLTVQHRPRKTATDLNALLTSQREALRAHPRMDPVQLRQLTSEIFGVEGAVSSLDGERDATYRVAGREGSAIVKISNPVDGESLVELQTAALEALRGRGLPVPEVIRTRSGRVYERLSAERFGEPPPVIWAMSELPGVPLHMVADRPDELLTAIGSATARVHLALRGFSHPAADRDFHWELEVAPEVVATRLQDGHTDLRHAVETVMNKAAATMQPLWGQLPRSVIHNDLNDYNILLAAPTHPWDTPAEVTGVIDFGDLVHSVAVGDLAVLLAYVMAGRSRMFEEGGTVVRAWHAQCPLSEAELAALLPLVAMRVSLSLAHSAYQRTLTPGNEYLGVSEKVMTAALATISTTIWERVEFEWREACGFEGAPRAGRVRRYLQTLPGKCAPVLGAELHEKPLVLDLSVSSPLVAGDPELNSEPHLTRRVADAMAEVGATVGVGRYDEPRLLYTAPFFGDGDSPLSARRTLHIGLDLFAPAGTPVFAPLDGEVEAFANNAALLDYGPVIILRHRTDAGEEFFTLYGHLATRSLDSLFPGKRIARGECFAWLGAPHENVGWSPHLHLQVMVDLLGRGTDFPGVGDVEGRSFWRAFCPDPNLLAAIPVHAFPEPELSDAELLAARERHSPGNLTLSFGTPFRAARGFKQYLYDAGGRRYLDAFNNVPHVGHSHPVVVRAVADQLAVLNTNTRYLQELHERYTERLVEQLPPSLEVCFLVNSGSEGNELALRLARAATGREHVVVLESAYHGNTNAAIDMSPYKHAGPGGRGAPPWVHAVPQPDPYRGSASGGASAEHFAAHVARVVERLASDPESGGVAAFIAESCPSVGGQIIPPHDYFREVYRVVRSAGGVCIADEVQTGFGRMGSAFWGFELFDVVPDIVVLGKPMANGYPMGAVVTTREIADAFANGMEFFSTFGGSSAACAAGLAVLRVLSDEGLQERARLTGEVLGIGLRELQRRHAIIGDVRGSGLFWGVELVADRATKEPAPRAAAAVVERMRQSRVLLGTDGPFHNVLKIRPPMQFGGEDAERLLATLDRALEPAIRGNWRRLGE